MLLFSWLARSLDDKDSRFIGGGCLFTALKMEPRASYEPGKHPTTELNPQPSGSILSL
jgi:hypothetical protein